jgi:hypothetical protein
MGIKAHFLLHEHTAIDQVFQECINWILDSPHTGFAQEDLASVSNSEDFNIQKGTEQIDYSQASAKDLIIGSLRYTKSNETHKWITEISVRKELDALWVSVVSQTVTRTLSVDTPELKKPLIIIRLIARFGGGSDGDFPITIEPILLDETAESREIAKAVINGDSRSTLPIIYVSATNNDKHLVIPDRLARKLSGVAHVLVEPSRSFSHEIRRYVSSRNVYGGAVGIYWPNGAGITLFRKGLNEIKAFEDAIFTRVCEALSYLIPPNKCSWEEVSHVKNRNAIEHIKNAGNSATEARELVELYELEIADKSSSIQALTREIDRLSTIVRQLESRTPVQGGILLDTGDEDDYFEGEIFELTLIAIKDFLQKSTHAKSRREHLLSSIVKSNLMNDLHEQKARVLKESLRGYREMTKKTRDTLEELGFSLVSEGKHWKITYQEDDRYTYILPKTGSDHRGGLNASAHISNIVY